MTGLCFLLLFPITAVSGVSIDIPAGLTIGKKVANNESKQIAFPCCAVEGGNPLLCRTSGESSRRLTKCPALCPRLQNIPNAFTGPYSRRHGSTVLIFCRRGYKLVGSSTITCNNGTWSKSPPTCSALTCGDPGRPTNGRTTAYDGYTFGKRVTFSCNYGYFIKGATAAICRANGKWSTLTPKCIALCPILQNVPNVFTTPYSRTHGSSVWFFCPLGYKLVGSSKVTCNNGTWSESLPACSAVTCGDPGSPIKGKTIADNGYSFGERVRFSCNVGYFSNGATSAICRANGKWSTTLPKCLALCPRLQNIPNGFTTPFILRHGAKVRIFCRRGYNLVGASVITCNNGTWSEPPPTCSAISCGDPGSPKNGTTVASNGYSFGKIVRFSCNDGYLIEGGTSAICRVNGKWSRVLPTCSADAMVLQFGFFVGEVTNGNSGITCSNGSWSASLPTCSAVSCGDPGSPINGGTVANSGYNFSKIVVFLCDAGYGIEGATSAICRSNGKWSRDVPKCSVLCPILKKIPNAYSTVYFRRHGSKVSIFCQRGYKLIGNSELTCNNGTWSGLPPTCSVVSCGDPGSPINGTTVANSGYTFGRRVWFLCNDGYLTEGATSAICRADGNWSRSLPKCSALCPILRKIPNGFSTIYSRRHGSTVLLFCQRGYNLIGNSELTCNNGTWSGPPPTCSAVSCGDPGSPINGTTVAKNGYTFGRRVWFLCNNGYLITEGAATAICKSDGNWSRSLPKCSALCPRLQNTNAITGLYSRRHGSKVSLYCRRGYELVGSSQITCNNGIWSESTPTCSAVICGDPGTPINGKTISDNGYSFGKRVTFSCNDGYFAKGFVVAYCMANGKWSSALPECSVLCPKLQNIPNGLTKERIASAIFFCRRGYKLVGSSEITCNNGTWSQSPPTCAVASCSNPGIPLNGKQFADNGFGFGKRVWFTCSDGYTLVGTPFVTCQRNGRWSNPPPRCFANT